MPVSSEWRRAGGRLGQRSASRMQRGEARLSKRWGSSAARGVLSAVSGGRPGQPALRMPFSPWLRPSSLPPSSRLNRAPGRPSRRLQATGVPAPLVSLPSARETPRSQRRAELLWRPGSAGSLPDWPEWFPMEWRGQSRRGEFASCAAGENCALPPRTEFRALHPTPEPVCPCCRYRDFFPPRYGIGS